MPFGKSFLSTERRVGWRYQKGRQSHSRRRAGCGCHVPWGTCALLTSEQETGVGGQGPGAEFRLHCSPSQFTWEDGRAALGIPGADATPSTPSSGLGVHVCVQCLGYRARVQQGSGGLETCPLPSPRHPATCMSLRGSGCPLSLPPRPTWHLERHNKYLWTGERGGR